uniref:Reverse transcriptase Ty1/copia-type domain-containing protein n=1 Tax=Solanum lycopersicum TaxID=4081 RepID=A0A3Q7EXK7_SOLLC
MSSSKPIDTPSAANIHLTAMFAPQSEEEKEYMSRVPYASAVGSLMYAMAVKRIFRYLRGTSDVGLSYGGDTQCLVTGYSDFDYAGDVDTRRSMTGYVFTLGGSVVSWKATLQPTVTLSTTEAEYMALTEAAKEGIWLKRLKAGLEKCTSQPTPMAVSSSTNGADTPFADITHFRSLIGALQYLAITHPDIQFAVNRIAQRMHQPSEHDYHCLKRILWYIFGTLGRGLLIRPRDLELRGFSDSDWANDKNDRKSTSRFLLFLGGRT